MTIKYSKMSATDTEAFGWACYWNLKGKDDEIRALREIITRSKNVDSINQLISLDRALKTAKEEKEARKVARMVRTINSPGQKIN